MEKTLTARPDSNMLSRSMKLIYVYALATGAIFTFMCYWDGIFVYTDTFLAFAFMTVLILPTAFVYLSFQQCYKYGIMLVFNTVGINKHAGFWSSWLVLCAWIAVPAAGVLGIIDWLKYQFNFNWTDWTSVAIGACILLLWFSLSMYKNVVAGKIQTFMLFCGIGGILICSLMFFFSGHWSIANMSSFFASSKSMTYGGSFSTAIAWIVGCSFMITPYFGFENSRSS